ncbi:acetyl-CoA C-acetyltransferase [Salinisphaera sp. LB1]|uniref:acetyl-CoA C-acetyltransferase n=1 Tax=Salinisphaera sp. LB1 TaxID=2183911 RepID=UPI000D70715D|nr:acetyl-CoA C-acetyltransferase [Salinisphaera sp. LB1]AWN15087.1 3-ketoacyl-CoA thiolase, Acetyl-CoA acetyltransferase [Salinisphaera sp. LB1]
MANDVVIAAAQRTAIGRLSGTLAELPASRLGAALIRDTLSRHEIDPDVIDEVVLGQVLTAGCGQNPARQAARHAGLPDRVPAATLNRVCGSGLSAVIEAARMVALGDVRVVIAGGQESMSQAPHLLPGSRRGRRLGEWPMQDSMIHDGLWDAFNDYHMGRTAENVAHKYRVARAEQDEFAAASQQRAEQAAKHGRFEDEILPVEVPQKAGDAIAFARDEGPRPGVTAESLAGLKPAFLHDGTVTAGNASGLNDGAALVVVTTAARCRELGLTPLARIAGYATVGVDPALMGIGPVVASQACLQRVGWSVRDLDLIEANEAFAAQAIAVNRQMQWPLDRVNVNGGAIALGHPVGASGCRILVTLLHEMGKREARRGLATLCVGGGQGVALAVERP